MMDRVKRFEADQVIVFAFSRFARSTMHLLKGLQIFKDCQTRFVSTTCSQRLRQIKGLLNPNPKYPRPAPGDFL
jgi:DNA invertase Pin-like site-specific DNA recombinase